MNVCGRFKAELAAEKDKFTKLQHQAKNKIQKLDAENKQLRTDLASSVEKAEKAAATATPSAPPAGLSAAEVEEVQHQLAATQQAFQTLSKQHKETEAALAAERSQHAAATQALRDAQKERDALRHQAHVDALGTVCAGAARRRNAREHDHFFNGKIDVFPPWRRASSPPCHDLRVGWAEREQALQTELQSVRAAATAASVMRSAPPETTVEGDEGGEWDAWNADSDTFGHVAAAPKADAPPPPLAVAVAASAPVPKAPADRIRDRWSAVLEELEAQASPLEDDTKDVVQALAEGGLASATSAPRDGSPRAPQTPGSRRTAHAGRRCAGLGRMKRLVSLSRSPFPEMVAALEDLGVALPDRSPAKSPVVSVGRASPAARDSASALQELERLRVDVAHLSKARGRSGLALRRGYGSATQPRLTAQQSRHESNPTPPARTADAAVAELATQKDVLHSSQATAQRHASQSQEQVRGHLRVPMARDVLQI